MALIQPVEDGKIPKDTSTTSKSDTSNDLGYDQFLQLLCAEMQYQDPLEPMDNTAMVSQLAQFSALEEMQNVSSALSNSQALSLVGKNVIIEVGKSTENANTTTVGGKVQYVQIVDGKAKLAINGQLYDYDDFDMVVDDKYLEELKKKDESDKTTDTDNKKDESDKTTDTDTKEDTAE